MDPGKGKAPRCNLSRRLKWAGERLSAHSQFMTHFCCLAHSSDLIIDLLHALDSANHSFDLSL